LTSPPLARRSLAEYRGTAFLVAVVVGSGHRRPEPVTRQVRPIVDEIDERVRGLLVELGVPASP
jgi:hypothetical protein